MPTVDTTTDKMVRLRLDLHKRLMELKEKLAKAKVLRGRPSLNSVIEYLLDERGKKGTAKK